MLPLNLLENTNLWIPRRSRTDSVYDITCRLHELTNLHIEVSFKKNHHNRHVSYIHKRIYNGFFVIFVILLIVIRPSFTHVSEFSVLKMHMMHFRVLFVKFPFVWSPFLVVLPPFPSSDFVVRSPITWVFSMLSRSFVSHNPVLDRWRVPLYLTLGETLLNCR